MLKYFGTYTDREIGGVSFAWNKNNTVCTANGTANSLAITNLYSNKSALPSEIDKGKKYFIKCSTSDPNLLLDFTIDGENETAIYKKFIVEDTEVTFPENSVGLVARIRVRDNTTVNNATIMISFLNAPSNEQLEGKVNELKTSIDDIANAGSLAVKKNKEYSDYANSILGLVTPNNIFDKSYDEENSTNGWYLKKVLDLNTGELVDTASNICVTYLIPVLDKKKISFKYGSGQLLATMRHAAAYDINEQLISVSGVNTQEWDLPDGACYVRVEYTYGSGTAYNNHVTISDDKTVGIPYEDYFEPYNINRIDSFDFLRCFHKFCGIGDSLMAGFTKINDITVNSATGVGTKNNWFDYLVARLNREGYNLAIGSSTTHNWRYGSQEGFPSTDLSGADIEGVDCYFIGLGVNDLRNPSLNVIGTSTDIDSSNYNNNTDSTYGNLDYIIHKLGEYNPYAKVFMFTIPWDGNNDPTDINNAIRYICDINDNAFCIDLTIDNPVSNNDFIKANFTGNHFNPIVYNYLSTIIEKRVNSFIYDNYTDFVWIPYEH